MKNNNEPFVIQYANFKFTDIVDTNNKFIKNVPISEAKRMAREANLDLVCFNEPNFNEPALCKIIDFGKWKFNNEKQKKKNNNSGRKETKEIQFKPLTEDHDIQHKVRHINEFLDDGNEVLLTMVIKGRDRGHFDLAEEKMNKIVSLCIDHGKEVYRKNTPGLISIRLSKHMI